MVECKLGEILKAAKAAGHITKGHATSNQYSKFADVPDENISKTTLSDAGITRKESSRAQKLADVPRDD